MTTILAAYDLLHWALRPVRALVLAYRHVLTGTPVKKPYNWKDI